MQIVKSVDTRDIPKIPERREITESTDIKGVNKARKVTLDDDSVWVMKERKKERISRWRYIPNNSQYLRERAVFLVDQQLGWNLVPITKIVKYKGDLASMQSWVNGSKSDITLRQYTNSYIWEMALLDAVVGSTDRHSGNFISRETKPIAIDNGFSFPTKADENDPRCIILSRFVKKVWGQKIPDNLKKDLMRLEEKVFQNHIQRLVGTKAFILFQRRLNTLIETGIMQFTGYIILGKIEKIPPAKH